MRILCSFYLLVFLGSCYTTSISPQTNSICDYKIEDNNEINEIISIKRGACFGTCPIYLISISSDRSGTYHGKKFVEKTGTVEFKLSEDEIIKGDGSEYMTAKDIEKEINELTQEGSAYWSKTHPNHNKAVQEVLKLREMLNG